MLIVSPILSILAGACIYLMLLNRYLLLIEDGESKKLILRVSLVAIGLGAILFGWWAAGTLWMLLPIGVLAGMLAGEARRAIIRRRHAGEPPIEATNAGVSWRTPITTTDLAVYRYVLTAPGWRGRDLRIVHLSDLHVNGDLSAEYYRAALLCAAKVQPDLLIYTGDLVTKVEYAAALPDMLSVAKGRLATLVILGNHDYWAGATQVKQAVRAAGVTLLGDSCLRLAVDGQGLTICGYEGPWSRETWQPPPVAPGELALMLTHTPDNIYRLSRLGYTAVFAGHYHAGQVRLPWLGSLVVPSRYGRRFDHGHFVVNGTHLFVSAGIGSAVPPKRVYCQPDLFIVDIRGDGILGTPEPGRDPAGERHHV
jgi:predicted MPP superfamily phosphohydrolase